MSPERFDALVDLVRPHLPPRARRRPDQISAEERVAITLRYLCTGNSQASESFNFLAGRSTVSGIVKEVCKAIWQGLQIYLKTPSTTEEYKHIAGEFMEQWDFPHTIGAVDGKHIQIECPKYGGSDYYNRKGTHSTILMAVCDANYAFTHVSIGSYGKESDATIFSNMALAKRLEEKVEPVPPEEEIVPGGPSMPYFFVGDEIFPLKPWLMKPYPGQAQSLQQDVFNFRLSRARRTIENAFGILAAKWRIFRRPIRADVGTIDLICQAAVCLHNYLLTTDNAKYTPAGFVDSYTPGGKIVEGDWRQIVKDDARPALGQLWQQGSNFSSLTARQVRDEVRQLVNGPLALSWQVAHVQGSNS